MEATHLPVQVGFLEELDKRPVEFQTQIYEVLQLLEDYNKVKLLGEGKDIGGVVELVNFLNERNYIQILSLETVLTEGSTGKNKGMIQIWAEITKKPMNEPSNPNPAQATNQTKPDLKSSYNRLSAGGLAPLGEFESPDTSEEEEEREPNSDF